MDQEPRLSCRNLFGVLRGHGSFGKARKRWSPRIGRKNPSSVHKSGENKLPRWQSAQSRCLLHRPCPQTGPGRRLQKKPRPLDAGAPPRTCGPAPRPGPRLRPLWGAVQGQVVPAPEACPSLGTSSALRCQDFSSGPAPARRSPPLLRSAPTTRRNPQEGGA